MQNQNVKMFGWRSIAEKKVNNLLNKLLYAFYASKSTTWIIIPEFIPVPLLIIKTVCKLAYMAHFRNQSIS